MKSGYTKFSNAVLQALPHIRASAGIKDTYLAVFRLTLGWQIKERALSYEDISILTGYSRGMQYTYVKQALALNLLIRVPLGTVKPRFAYSVNLDPKTWRVRWRITDKHFSTLLTKILSRTGGTNMSRKLGTKVSRKLGTDPLGIILDTPIR